MTHDPEDPDTRKRLAVAEIMPKTPFIGHLGGVFDRYEPDVVLRLPFREDLTNDGAVGSCRKSDLVCTARTVRRARELIFTEIEAADADGRIVASAIQTYRITS